jgi:hypothetical protein
LTFDSSLIRFNPGGVARRVGIRKCAALPVFTAQQDRRHLAVTLREILIARREVPNWRAFSAASLLG